MTLPNPGVSLSLSEIQTEFGGTNPASLDEYYAGGAYVPAGTNGYYGEIPSSGTIAISDFYGSSKTPSYTVGCAGTYGSANFGQGVGPVVDGYVSSTPFPAPFSGPYGSVSSTLLPGSRTLLSLCYQTVTPPKSTTIDYVWFIVSGNQTAWTWTSWTLPSSSVLTRASAGSGSSGTYNATYDYTAWWWLVAQTACGTWTLTI